MGNSLSPPARSQSRSGPRPPPYVPTAEPWGVRPTWEVPNVQGTQVHPELSALTPPCGGVCSSLPETDLAWHGQSALGPPRPCQAGKHEARVCGLRDALQALSVESDRSPEATETGTCTRYTHTARPSRPLRCRTPRDAGCGVPRTPGAAGGSGTRPAGQGLPRRAGPGRATLEPRRAEPWGVRRLPTCRRLHVLP